MLSYQLDHNDRTPCVETVIAGSNSDDKFKSDDGSSQSLKTSDDADRKRL